MTIKNFQVAPLSNILTTLSFPTTISVDSILSLVGLTSKLKELDANFKTAVKALFDSYGIEASENGTLDWSKSEKVDEISAKWQELINTENTIDIVFSDTELYAKLVAGRSMQEALILKEVLV